MQELPETKKSNQLTPKQAVSKYKERAEEALYDKKFGVAYNCWVAIYIVAKDTPGMETTTRQALDKIRKFEKQLGRRFKK